MRWLAESVWVETLVGGYRRRCTQAVGIAEMLFVRQQISQHHRTNLPTYRCERPTALGSMLLSLIVILARAEKWDSFYWDLSCVSGSGRI